MGISLSEQTWEFIELHVLRYRTEMRSMLPESSPAETHHHCELNQTPTSCRGIIQVWQSVYTLPDYFGVYYEYIWKDT